MRRTWLAILVVSIALFNVLWWIETTYSPLRDSEEYNKSYKPNYKRNPGDDLVRGISLIVRGIEAHHDLWLVLETLALVGFTGTLWWSTRRLWQETASHADHLSTTAKAAQTSADAAMLHARAAVAAEVAEMGILYMGLARWPEPPQGVPDTTIQPNAEERQMRINISLQNIGRTRTIVHELCIEWDVIARPPNDRNPDPPRLPVYKNIVRRPFVFIRGQAINMQWMEGANSIVTLTEKQVIKIKTDLSWLWIWGYYTYSDFLSDTYRCGFAAHWESVASAALMAAGSDRARGFVQEGPSAYIYKHKLN